MAILIDLLGSMRGSACDIIIELTRTWKLLVKVALIVKNEAAATSLTAGREYTRLLHMIIDDIFVPDILYDNWSI